MVLHGTSIGSAGLGISIANDAAKRAERIKKRVINNTKGKAFCRLPRKVSKCFSVENNSFQFAQYVAL
jgi:hypothetical protein